LRDLKTTRVIVAHRPATVAHADMVIPFARLGQSRTAVKKRFIGGATADA